MGTNTPKKTEYRLKEKRRFDHAPIGKIGESIKMTDVVAFDFKPCAVRSARGQNIFDVSEGIFEDSIARPLKIRFFPVVFEALITGQHWVKAEVHRTHIERGYFWLEGCGRSE